MIERLHPVINSARYGITGYEDGRWCIWSLGGEIKLYLQRSDDRIVLVESERNWHERTVFTARNQDDIQLVLLFRFMNRYRRDQLEKRYLSPVKAPISASNVAPGFNLIDTQGTWRLENLNSAEHWTGSLVTLVEFSYYSHMDPYDLWESLYAPEDGKFVEILT